MSMVFALVLLGCADDGGACERLATLPERYDAKALCQAQEEAALDSEIALRSDYPTVLARCLPHAAAAKTGKARVRLAMRGF